MKAMILAAGLGTRLKPLTDMRPKALVEINGIPLLELVIKKLIRHGFSEFVVNVHHHASMIVEFLRRNNNFGVEINISDETELLLDTGGGIKHAAKYLNDGEDFLLHNVDILTDLNLTQMIENHKKKQALATLAVRDRSTSRYFLFDENDRLCGWKNVKSGEIKICIDKSGLKPLAFSGVHIINSNIFSHLKQEGAFSIVDVYLRGAAENLIQAYRHDSSFWMDLGSIKNLEAAQQIRGIDF